MEAITVFHNNTIYNIVAIVAFVVLSIILIIQCSKFMNIILSSETGTTPPSLDKPKLEPGKSKIPSSRMPVPGRRCPSCLERGQTVWVIPGKCCPQCGTPVN